MLSWVGCPRKHRYSQVDVCIGASDDPAYLEGRNAVRKVDISVGFVGPLGDGSPARGRIVWTHLRGVVDYPTVYIF